MTSTRTITVLTDVSLITCTVQRNKADDVIKAAQDAGAQGATVHFAHGCGIQELLGVLSVTVDADKEVINIVAATDQVDRIFESMFLAANLDTPGMGFIYITDLEKAATYIHPDILAKLQKEKE